jgi:hypothetical protein
MANKKCRETNWYNMNDAVSKPQKQVRKASSSSPEKMSPISVILGVCITPDVSAA